MSLTLPDPNKVPGDANHTSDTNLIIEAINTLKSEVDGIPLALRVLRVILVLLVLRVLLRQ
jgi:hypothetical protein